MFENKIIRNKSINLITIDFMLKNKLLIDYCLKHYFVLRKILYKVNRFPKG